MYWNHNTAYHPWVVAHVRSQAGRVLDVGSGDGLLLERLAPVVDNVVGIECDECTAEASRERLATVPNVSIVTSTFPDDQFAPSSFDAVLFVASLHHMDPRQALRGARALLKPGGQLLVVGLVRNASAPDWLFSALVLPFSRISSALHNELKDPGCAITEPRESLAELRRVFEEELPGYQLRRGLHYRYLMRWAAPGRMGGEA